MQWWPLTLGAIGKGTQDRPQPPFNETKLQRRVHHLQKDIPEELNKSPSVRWSLGAHPEKVHETTRTQIRGSRRSVDIATGLRGENEVDKKS